MLVGGAVTCNLITRKVFNEKILYYNILRNSRGKLQEYVLKNGGFKKFKVTLP